MRDTIVRYAIRLTEGINTHATYHPGGNSLRVVAVLGEAKLYTNARAANQQLTACRNRAKKDSVYKGAEVVPVTLTVD